MLRVSRKPAVIKEIVDFVICSSHSSVLCQHCCLGNLSLIDGVLLFFVSARKNKRHHHHPVNDGSQCARLRTNCRPGSRAFDRPDSGTVVAFTSAVTSVLKSRVSSL